MLGSVSPRKLLAPFTATKTEAMIANHKVFQVSSWTLWSENIWCDAFMSNQGGRHVNHNSVVLAYSNIFHLLFWIFNSSQHKVLSIKFGRALDSLDLIACQPKDCPKFHCLSGELPVGLPLRRSFIACPSKVRLTLKAAAACSRLSAAAKQEIKVIHDSLDILLFFYLLFLYLWRDTNNLHVLPSKRFEIKFW